MTGVTDIAVLLDRCWGLRAADVRPVAGGINSETWLVEHAGAAYVAKQVAAAALHDLVAGCEVAATLADSGIVTGRPVPTADGRLVVTEHALALLEHVPGRELEGEDDQEQGWIARTLAAVHDVGGASRGPSPATFMTDWLMPELPGVSAHPWLVRVVADVRAETDALELTWSGLHTDPAPEAFVHDDSTGVTGPLADSEVRHLDAFRRFQEAVQGTYFAWRVAVGDLTGGVEQADNDQGLDDARRRLADLGVDTG